MVQRKSVLFSVIHCVAGLAVILLSSSYLASNVDAQELRKAINDYRNERPFQYQPSDPWTRSKLFQTQTKHYGLFYNCNNEECKRNSPYICWKTHFEKDFPTLMTARQRIRHEWGQVAQRILDGAGMCAEGCGCTDCQTADSTPSCQCSECTGSMGAPYATALPQEWLSRDDASRNLRRHRSGLQVADRGNAAHQNSRWTKRSASGDANRKRAPQATTQPFVSQNAGLIAVQRPALERGTSFDESKTASQYNSTATRTPTRTAQTNVPSPNTTSLLDRFRKIKR